MTCYAVFSQKTTSYFCWKRRAILLAMALLLTGVMLPSGLFALEIELLWVANPNMIMEGAPMVVDLDQDGDAEILTAAYENIIVVDGSGKELWRFDTRGRYSTCPAVLERTGKSPLIYAGDNKGLFTCLDGAGNVIWQRDMGHMFCSSATLADTDADGSVEVLQGDANGLLTALDAHTGAFKWKQSLQGKCSSAAVGDVDGDGALEVVIATGSGKVYALNGAGDVRWTFTVGGKAPFWAIASPVIFADSGGKVRVAAASHDGRVCCLDGRGQLLWESAARGPVASTLSVGDFDADGRADLFVVTELGRLYRFDEEGRVLWDIDTQARSLASGAIVDLDGDGRLEYILSAQRGSLFVFGRDGEVLWQHQFQNRTINVTPAFGDIVKDRPGLEFAVTGGESGQIFCFGAPGPVGGAAPWRTYRGDRRLTGAWLELAGTEKVRMTAENLTWDQLYSGEDVTFRIVNPTPAKSPLSAEVTCVRPDGTRQVAVGKIVGQRGVLKVPVSITAPGEYRFQWALKKDSGVKILGDSRVLTLQPYRNDQALVMRAVLAVRDALGAVQETHQEFAAALQQELAGIEEEAGALVSHQTAAPAASLAARKKLAERTARLNSRAKRAVTLAQLARSVALGTPGTQLVLFQGTTWENRAVDQHLPQEFSSALRVTERGVPGEHVPVVVKVLNVTLDPVSVGVRVEPATDGGPAAAAPPSVVSCEVKPVPTNQGETAWDPIVPVAGGRITIPPLEAREVWLDFDLKDVKPGTHEFQLSIDTGRSTTQAEISLEVLPFEMAGFGAMRLCCWSQYNDDAVADLLAHGNNVFTVGLPAATVLPGAGAQLQLDFTALDEFVARLSGHDVFLLMGGIPSLGVPVEDEAYVPRLAEFLERLMAHLKARGIAENQVALYPHDEPGGHGWDTVRHYIAFARRALKARPGLQFYVNGGGDLPMFEALNEVASLWCPSYYMLAEQSPEMNFLRESGKILWSYDCGYSYARPIGANTKTINVVAQYRLAALFAFHHGATGLGYWCYNVGEPMWEAVAHEYPLVYKNSDGTHTTSRRWEAVREGMEDTRILIALRDRLADTSLSAEAAASIRQLLEETLPRYARQSLAEVHLGVARYVIDDSNNDLTVASLRREIMTCAALTVRGN